MYIFPHQLLLPLYLILLFYLFVLLYTFDLFYLLISLYNGFRFYLFISLYIFSLLSIQISSSYLSDISVPVPITIPCSHLSVYLSLYFISHKHPLLSFFLSLGWWFCMREVVAFNWAGDELINLSSSYYSKHAKTPLNGLSVIDDDDVDDARRLRGWKWCRKVCTFEVVVE